VVNGENTLSLFVDDSFVPDVYIPRTGISQEIKHDMTSVCRIGHYYQWYRLLAAQILQNSGHSVQEFANRCKVAELSLYAADQH
jgi:hypothetical protein